jgi:hypothetical protein
MNKLSYVLAILIVFYVIHFEYTLRHELNAVSYGIQRYDDYFESTDYLIHCDSFMIVCDDEVFSNKKYFFCKMRFLEAEGEVVFSNDKSPFVGLRDTVSNMIYLKLSYAGDFRNIPVSSKEVLLDARKRTVNVLNNDDYISLDFQVLDSTSVRIKKFENKNTVRF